MVTITPDPNDLSIKEIIEMFYLYEFENDKLDVFYFYLIGALTVADRKNLKRLKIVYPNFVYVLKTWLAAGNYGTDLFKAYNIGKFAQKDVIDLD